MRRPATLITASLGAAALSVGALAAVVPAAGPAAADPPGEGTTRTASSEARVVTGKRTVMVVGNNWEGTATIVDARTKRRLAELDIVPDLEQELRDIALAPDRAAFYAAVRAGIGEGNDQYVDDAFTTNDGRFLAVSRPSLSDVVWIDLRKAAAGDPDPIAAEQSLDGYRSDHMGVSPDGRRLVVSDSTERQVVEFSMVTERRPSGRMVRMGQRLRSFTTGDTPHENNYSANGKRIFHASIGRVYTAPDSDFEAIPDDFVHDTVKADRWMQVVRTSDFRVLRRWDMGKELREAGYPDMSSAVRPVAYTPDEKTWYLQVSFLHGFVEFKVDRPDIRGSRDYRTGPLGGPTMREPESGRVTRVVRLPNLVPDVPREQYVLDSAHHGIAMNPTGNKLCVAGTMSDYAAIVDRDTWTPRVLRGGGDFAKPYWATEGPGNTCWVSMSGTDLVAVIDFRTERVLARIPVGDHPQRVREGHIRERIVATF